MAWPWFTTSATLVDNESLVISSVIWSGSNATYLCLGLTGLALSLAPSRIAQPLRSGLPFLLCACGYPLVSLAYLRILGLTGMELGPADKAIAVIWPIACGACQAFLYIAWVRIWGCIGPKATVVIVVSASLISAGSLLAFGALPGTIQKMLLLITGVTGTWCAWRSTLVFGKACTQEETAPRQGPRKHGGPKTLPATRRRLPWKLLLSACAAGLSFGIFQSLSISGSLGFGAWNNFGVAAFVLAALCLLASVFFFRLNFNYMIYRVAFALMGVGAFVSFVVTRHPDIGYGIFCLGYRYFEAVLWCLCAYLIYQEKAQAAWIGGMAVATLWLGRFVGFEAVTHLMPTDETSTPLVIVLLVTLLPALYLVSHNNLAEAWGMKMPSEVDPRQAATEHAVSSIAKEFSLSTRESEVLRLLANERTRAEISRSLSLSEETVKSHVSHIYQKCDLHSRQELQVLLRERVAQYEKSPSMDMG